MRILCTLFFLLLLISCRQAPTDRASAETTAAVPSDTVDSAVVKFPLPQVPALLTGAEERQGYALKHFWEAYDFADTTAHNRAVGEQGMAEFIGLLDMASEPLAEESIKKYLAACMSDQSLRAYHTTLVRHYLGNPDSPLRNDALYERFLVLSKRYYTADDVAERERCAFELEMLRLNRVGTLAADFTFVSRDGSRSRLYNIVSPYTLIIFTDPTCDKCQQQLPQMVGQKLLSHPDLAVVALYPDEDMDSWQQHPKALPAHWIDAYSPEGEVMSTPLYHLPALPSLYLLDAEKHVLLRDASVAELLQYLTAHLPQQ
jgi:hypothetical protein